MTAGSTHNGYPVLGRIVKRAPNVSPEDYFERGFDILLDGLRGRLLAKQATSNGRKAAKPPAEAHLDALRRVFLVIGGR